MTDCAHEAMNNGCHALTWKKNPTVTLFPEQLLSYQGQAWGRLQELLVALADTNMAKDVLVAS